MAIFDRLRRLFQKPASAERVETVEPQAEPDLGPMLDIEGPVDVPTPHGDIRLLPITDELLESVSKSFALGVRRLPQPVRGARFGIVMLCGATELLAVKWQPPDCEARVGKLLFGLHVEMLRRTVPMYQREGFPGLIFPAAYLRSKPDGSSESGIAFFGGVSAAVDGSIESEPPALRLVDDQFGPGFVRMMMAFWKAMQQSALELDTPMQTIISVEVRPRSKLASLHFELMVHGRNVIYTQVSAFANDPLWSTLRERGIREVFHMPSIPLKADEPDGDSRA